MTTIPTLQPLAAARRALVLSTSDNVAPSSLGSSEMRSIILASCDPAGKDPSAHPHNPAPPRTRRPRGTLHRPPPTRARPSGILIAILATACGGATQSERDVRVSSGYPEVATRLAAAIERERADKGLAAVSIALVDGDEVVWGGRLRRPRRGGARARHRLNDLPGGLGLEAVHRHRGHAAGRRRPGGLGRARADVAPGLRSGQPFGHDHHVAPPNGPPVGTHSRTARRALLRRRRDQLGRPRWRA